MSPITYIHGLAGIYHISHFQQTFSDTFRNRELRMNIYEMCLWHYVLESGYSTIRINAKFCICTFASVPGVFTCFLFALFFSFNISVNYSWRFVSADLKGYRLSWVSSPHTHSIFIYLFSLSPEFFLSLKNISTLKESVWTKQIKETVIILWEIFESWSSYENYIWYRLNFW